MTGRARAFGSALKAAVWCLVLTAGACTLANVACAPADASIRRHHWQPVRLAVRLADPEKDAALIVDGETGKTLYARNADALRHPASLTKMMTLYLLFQELKSGQMSLATPLLVSGHAAEQARTKLYLRPGTEIPVDTAIRAIVVLSANDVAVTIAEAIGGSESRFAELMTAKARSWGMTHTYFHNASGLPDPLQITSADDLAILARHLAYDFPQYFHYFSTYSFGYRGATYFTHDNLIGRYQGADGIKTGYTGASGFNLVSSVVRNGVHIIGVVMGGTTARRRDSEMMHLLDDTFAAITQNPQLVARTNVPWQALAENSGARPMIAGFPFASVASSPSPLRSSAAAPPLHQDAVDLTGEDEEAAESRPDPAYEPQPTRISPPAPLPRQITPPRQPAAGTAEATRRVVVASIATPAGQIFPRGGVTPAPAIIQTTSAVQTRPPVMLSSVPLPEPKPQLDAAAFDIPEADTAAPKLREASLGGTEAAAMEASLGNAPPARATVGSDWTIQIGAFGDVPTAKAELATYAERSQDILGQAARIVAPFQSADGHVLYRARFGPFAEQDARQACEVLTKRGQTCFAAVASP